MTGTAVHECSALRRLCNIVEQICTASSSYYKVVQIKLQIRHDCVGTRLVMYTTRHILSDLCIYVSELKDCSILVLTAV